MADPEKSRKGLGRGLSALLGDEKLDYSNVGRAQSNREVPIEYLRPNRYQPRHKFDSASIAELADSIRDRGVLQPILVRRIDDDPDQFEIVAGERRWRAAQRAQLHTVPVLIQEITETEALELALIENIQREDLSPIDEALGYRHLIDDFGHTQEKVADLVGKSRSHVANTLRLLGLPEPVQDWISEGHLSPGHARTLIGADDPLGLAKRIMRDALTVRQAEFLSKKSGGGGKQARSKPVKDANTRELERTLSNALGLRVTIEHKGERGGAIKIHYRTIEQLDDVCLRLAQTPSKDQI